MKKLVVALAAIALSAPAFAQQSSNGGKFGLGVSITPTTPWNTTTQTAGPVSPAVEVYVPLQLAPNLRLEPSLGIFSADANGASISDVTLGAGLFFQQKVAAPVDIYAGGRLKLNFASVDDGAGNDDSGVDFIIAAAAGAEYYLVPKFSLGLEAQLGFYSNSDVNNDTDGFFTNGLGFLRVYF